AQGEGEGRPTNAGGLCGRQADRDRGDLSAAMLDRGAGRIHRRFEEIRDRLDRLLLGGIRRRSCAPAGRSAMRLRWGGWSTSRKKGRKLAAGNESRGSSFSVRAAPCER